MTKIRQLLTAMSIFTFWGMTSDFVPLTIYIKHPCRNTTVPAWEPCDFYFYRNQKWWLAGGKLHS